MSLAPGTQPWTLGVWTETTVVNDEVRSDVSWVNLSSSPPSGTGPFVITPFSEVFYLIFLNLLETLRSGILPFFYILRQSWSYFCLETVSSF